MQVLIDKDTLSGEMKPNASTEDTAYAFHFYIFCVYFHTSLFL